MDTPIGFFSIFFNTVWRFFLKTFQNFQLLLLLDKIGVQDKNKISLAQ